ncbi:MAG: response regulator [Candidatus Desulfatibia sp.]|uniref:response regulator n=1 Tax=Candidatus Desulfatibia sp. TaxID=3101189 RepID=UPI002F33D0CF
MAKAKVLIVEDDGIIAMDLESRLKSFGYSVPGIVSYGEDAVKKVEECRPDLVFMDIVLKGEIDGIEAADQIRTQFNIPVVFVTAHMDEDRLERAKLTLPFGYVIKPFSGQRA